MWTWTFTLTLTLTTTLFSLLLHLTAHHPQGASEAILACCDSYTDSEGQVRPLTPAVRADVEAAINAMAKVRGGGGRRWIHIK